MTDITTTRQLIMQQAQLQLDSDKAEKTWFLLGTVGCHLCDEAENTLRLFSSVTATVIEKVDIADFDEDFMMQFATTIPVVLTPTQQINYPFSVVDLMACQ
ncbi:glutaredoxin family protein [Psychrobacter sp. UBA3962]|uniref:glutaredoxin family protein n=1 Tax=Psychrobacter sp. UBA3962 TaxID=1947352 RepID=UPI0025D7D603|nr:glutaredoxin family protein [Psychrobacter sp. UBA3962]